MQAFNMHFGTWNVGDAGPETQQIGSFLGIENPQKLPDSIAIGLQEVTHDKKWSSLLQEVLRPLDYVLLKVRNLSAIWLYVFVLRKHLPAITNVESEITASGFAGVVGNKGGVSIRFDWHGVNLIVVCAHFTAFQKNVKDRINDYLDILTSQKFRDPDVEVIIDHDYVFWLGDLNFRIDKLTKAEVETKIKEKKYDELLGYDQLKAAIKQGHIFPNFIEGKITFPPSYKFDPGTSTYDTGKKERIPSWTDRILYLVNHDSPHKLDVKLNTYTSLMKYCQSDHKPVIASFSVAYPQTLSNFLPVTFVTPLGSLSDSAKGKNESQVRNAGEFSYFVNPKVHDATFELDAWDWIAILPADFHSVMKDYFDYIYAPTSNMKEATAGPVKATIDKSNIEQLRGQKICLAYFSRKKNCIQGLSKPFVI